MNKRLKHAGIFGQTESGKSFLGQQMALGFKKRGIPRLVCDPFMCPNWDATFITPDIMELVKIAKDARGCAIFVDEAGQTIGNNPPKEVEWLTTGSRHWGHVIRLLGQRGKQMVSKTMRDQLSEIYLFNVNVEDAEDWAKCFNEPILANAHELKPHWFFYKRRHEPVVKTTLRV